VLHDLQLDSIQQLTLVVELENHFEVCFDPGDESGIETVHDVMDLVAARLEPGRGGGGDGAATEPENEAAARPATPRS
jgi:hypothetical protein